MADELVPFGKYKGQPLEVLAQDRKYLDWLTAQDWFRNQYQNIYTLVINNFTEPSETPEHNALQVLFLDDTYNLKLINKLNYEKNFEEVKNGVINRLESCYKRLVCMETDKDIDINTNLSVTFKLNPAVFEFKGIDVYITYRYGAVSADKGSLKYKEIKEEYREKYTYSLYNILEEESYVKIYEGALSLELKPTIGDDYPAILRQMKRTGSIGRSILFVGEYTGVGATREQFIETFRRSNITVVFKSEIE